MKINKAIANLIIYIIAGTVFMIPLLRYKASVQSSLGFYFGTIIVIVLRRKLFPVLCYFYIVVSNIYMTYVPLKFMDSITVMAVIKVYIIGYFIFLLILTKGFKKYFRKSPFKYYIIWVIISVGIHLISAMFFPYNIIDIFWRLVPLYFSLLVTIEIYRSKQNLNEILLAIIVSAILFTFVAYIELIQEKTYFYSLWTGVERYRYGILRVGSTLEDANILGLFLLPSIFIIHTNYVKNILGKIVVFFLKIFLIIILIITSSRMSFVAFTFGIITLYWVTGKPIKQMAVIIGIFFILCLTPYIFHGLITYEAASSSQRIFLIGEAFSKWLDNPILGIGIDGFWNQTSWLTMNEFAKQLVELGLFAFIVYLFFYLYLIKIFFKKIKYLKNIEKYDSGCILAATIAYMINSFSLDTYNYYIMWVLPALSLYFYGCIYKKDNYIKEKKLQETNSFG